MLDLTKAFDRMNFNILIEKLKKTHLLKQLVNLIDFMLRNSFASLNYYGFKGGDWLIGNGARRRGYSHLCCSVFFFKRGR